MKLESLVIVDQHATVNLYLGLVLPARHAPGVEWLRSPINPVFMLLMHCQAMHDRAPVVRRDETLIVEKMSYTKRDVEGPRTVWQLERSRNKVAVGEPAAGLTP